MTAPHLHDPHRPGTTRRAFVADLGRSAAGLVVVGLGLAGCSSGDDPTVRPPTGAASPTGPSTTPPDPTSADPTSSASEAAADGALGTVDLGFVAAYVLVRGGAATVVDTGVEGSADAILDVLTGLGVGWGDVSDVVLTHSHPDHAGSLAAVAEAAAGAALWAHRADIPAMTAPREIGAVADGDRIGDLEVIHTPGHTPGHIALLDRVDGSLFTGDALGGADGGLVGPNPEFTPDMPTAVQSVATLAAFEPIAIRVCHGFPVDAGAAELRALAEQLAGSG